MFHIRQISFKVLEDMVRGSINVYGGVKGLTIRAFDACNVKDLVSKLSRGRVIFCTLFLVLLYYLSLPISPSSSLSDTLFLALSLIICSNSREIQVVLHFVNVAKRKKKNNKRITIIKRKEIEI